MHSRLTSAPSSLAKAALYAGAKLYEAAGHGERGSHCAGRWFWQLYRPVHAAILGLIPDCELSRVQAVGNAAGDGARMILLDKQKRAEAQWAARWVTYVETAVEPSFQAEFVASIDIPHASDPYPHLEPLLARPKPNGRPHRYWRGNHPHQPFPTPAAT
ncbi:MAG: ASKHA domain-containing protein [Caldilineaceae bacterium]